MARPMSPQTEIGETEEWGELGEKAKRCLKRPWAGRLDGSQSAQKGDRDLIRDNGREMEERGISDAKPAETGVHLGLGHGRGGLRDKCIWVAPNEVIQGEGRFEEGVRTEGDMMLPTGGEGRRRVLTLTLSAKVRVRGRGLSEVHVAGEQMRRPASSSQDVCVIAA